MVSAMSSAHRRDRGAAYDDNDDDGDACDSNDQVNHVSSNSLRRRHNATSTDNGKYRLGASQRKLNEESGVNGGRTKVNAFPKSLTPFVHIQNTDAIDATLDECDNSSRSNSLEPNREEADVEAQQLQNRTISYVRENSMHASFLTNDSVTDFHNSGNSALSDDYGQGECSSRSSDKVEKLQDPPSVGSADSKPLRQRKLPSYDSENNDEILNSDDSRQTGSDGGSRKNAEKPNPDSLYGKFQRSRYIVGKFVNNAFVQIIILILIVANGVLLGFATTQWVTEDDEVEKVVSRIDVGLLIVFTIEIGMQIYYYAFAIFHDKWLVFDLFVVVISWIANWVSNDSKLSVLRAFRIFRITRLVTRVRPLRDLVLALGEVLPKMYAIVLLLLVVFYVFAVLFTIQFSEVPGMEYRYFNTLHDSFLSCFQMMTMEWVDICRPLMEEKGQKLAWIFIVLFVIISGFIVFNLIVAVVVEAVSQTEDIARRLDGKESNTPASQLVEAQERVDLLMSHLNEMTEQQEQIQYMLETMAGELLHLETERMKAKYRENRLREEINRRIEYQKKVEEGKAEDKQPNEAIKNMSMQFLQKIQASKLQRKKEEQEQTSSEHESVGAQSAKKKKKRISSATRDGSTKSVGSQRSSDSTESAIDQLDSPKPKSVHSKKKSDGSRGLTKGKSAGKEESKSEDRKKAIGNWKKLLAVQKEFEL